MGKNERSKVEMTDDEIAAFIASSRTATMATIGSTGLPHLVAMWYGVIDGDIWFETKAKAQKVVNLKRNDALSVLIEDGLTYNALRGVALEGRGEIIDDPDKLWTLGVDIWERYTGPYTEEMKPFVETMLHKRVCVRLHVERIRSWDHNKLGMAPMDVGGTTAPVT